MSTAEWVPYERLRKDNDARRELRSDGTVVNILEKSPIDPAREELECQLKITIVDEAGDYVPGASRKPSEPAFGSQNDSPTLGRRSQRQKISMDK